MVDVSNVCCDNDSNSLCLVGQCGNLRLLLYNFISTRVI